MQHIQSPREIAIAELRQKSLQTIERETAIKWANRALAAQTLGMGSVLVDEFLHEALEHAILSDDITLASVRQIMTLESANPEAVKEVRSKSLADIQGETAILWAWRAYEAQQLQLRDDAIVYRIEALEHAALAGDAEVICTVRQIIPQVI